MEKLNSSNIKLIMQFLHKIIIPVKTIKGSSNQENLALINKEEENEEYILLIIEIIWADYNNYFHYKNIEGILNFIKIVYNKSS